MAIRRTYRFVALLAVTLFSACFMLPGDPDRPPSHAVDPDPGVALASVGAAFQATHGAGVSGFKCVPDATEALRWRLLLIDRAEQTIDAQYYIWSGASGALFLEHLLRAADRGVRVRALVDDFTVSRNDLILAHFGAHPNLELRLFNPAHVRKGLLLPIIDSLGRIGEINQRMHNKLLIVDNHVAIVGGRNIGDEYYGIGEGFSFLDFDAVSAGPVVPELSACFDRYWNCEYAYPADQLTENIDEVRVQRQREKLQEYLEEKDAILASFQEPATWSESVSELGGALIPGVPEVIWDETHSEDGPIQVATALKTSFEEAKGEIVIMVAYVIPTDNFVTVLRETVERGVRVTILTNSLASLDSTSSNAWYKKYRSRVLEAGVDLFELRPDARDRHLIETPPNEGGATGMHTKLMVFDRHRVFIGSFNLEPRAARHNREDGMLVESYALAGAILDHIELFLDPHNSWRLRLDEEGGVLWESYDGVLDQQPARSDWQRLQDALIGILPVPEEYQ